MSGNEELIHAGKAIADALVRENVKKVFCLPGSHVLQIYDGLRQAPSIQLVTCKMEPNISLMADAYGRISGEPGVGLTTAGPGAINSLAGVAQAYGAASPMVHLTGSVPLNASREAFHGVDNPEFTVDMFRHATKWSVRLERLEDIPAVMAKAFHIARSGRPGPVHVEFPRATDYAPFILQPERVSYPVSSSQPAEVVEPTREDVEQVAQRILDAKLPVFCAGKGVIRKGAMEELAKLSEMFSIPVVYPQDAMGVIRDDHPFAAGHYAPARQDPRFKYVMEDADLIVSIGLRADTAEVDHLEAFGPSDRILVGFDNAEDEHYSKKDEFVADPKLFMTLLLERMSKESRPPNEELKSEIARIRTEYRTAVRAHLDGSRDNVPVHPGFIIESIADWVGPDDVVVSDVGNSQMWSRYYIPIHHHESLMQSGVWNAMSFCLPSAIVAKLEYPDRNVVGISGDGAFLMTIGDFVTACEYGANVVFVVFNDGAFSQMVGQQTNLYGESYGSNFESPNFAEIATACGGFGIRVDEPGALKPALEAARASGLAAIVDVVTTFQPTPPY